MVKISRTIPYNFVKRQIINAMKYSRLVKQTKTMINGLKWPKGSTQEWVDAANSIKNMTSTEIILRSLSKKALVNKLFRNESKQTRYLNRTYDDIINSYNRKIKRSHTKKLTKTFVNIKDVYEPYPFTTKVTKLKGNKVVKTEFTHDVPYYEQVFVNMNNLQEVQDMLVKIVNKHNNPVFDETKLKILWRLTIIFHSKRRFSTPFTSNKPVLASMLVKDQDKSLYNAVKKYKKETDLQIKYVVVSNILYSKVMGNASRSNVQASNKWHVVNPNSRTNCVYQSIVSCKFWKKYPILLDRDLGNKKRITSAKRFKKRVKPINNNLVDDETIQKICEYIKQDIKLYDNVFKLIKVFKPIKYKAIKETYELQRTSQHCLALIQKKDILKRIPDYKFPELKKKISTITNESDKIINKKKSFQKYNYKVASWDIETSLNSKNEHIPYACAIGWYNYEYSEPIEEEYEGWINIKDEKNPKRNKKDKDGKLVRKWGIKKRMIKKKLSKELQEQQFWGLDCVEQFIKFLSDNGKIFKGFTLYAHNGGKYDIPLIVDRVLVRSKLFQILGKECIELNNAWIGFGIMSIADNSFKIKFKDSYKLLPGSLDKLTKDLKVKHQKLTETVKHSDITLENYMTFPAIKRYLTHDVFGLLEVIEDFGDGVWNDLKIDITKCFTGASLSKKNYFKNYYDRYKAPIYSLSDKNDKFIRDSYFGGRVECFKMIKTTENKTYYYDFTSLYPDLGRKPLPYGKPMIHKMRKNIFD